MKTLLLFAGKSKRFWPLTEKPFWPIAGKTLLEHQIDRLRTAGAKDILLVGGKHNMEMAKAMNLPNVDFVVQELDDGMRAACLSALPQCDDEPVMLVSSNDFIDSIAYENIFAMMKTSSVDGVILAKRVDAYFPGGYLTVKGTRVTSIIEKPRPGKEPSDLVNIVAHAHRSASTLLKALKAIKTKKDDGYEQALDALFKDHHYEALPYDGVWHAVKYPWHLLSLLPTLLSEIRSQHIAQTAIIHPSAVIEGPVIIEDGVKIFAHATVMGPCYIGRNSIIANNALVRGSSIGESCVLGYNTEVVRSIVRKDVWTHSSYIGDTVIGENVSFGGGTTTGNLRLDEEVIHSKLHDEMLATGLTKFGAIIGDGCRTGIHTCISPGVKLGQNVFTSSNILITEDISDDSFVKQKDVKLEIRKNSKKAPRGREGFRKKL